MTASPPISIDWAPKQAILPCLAVLMFFLPGLAMSVTPGVLKQQISVALKTEQLSGMVWSTFSDGAVETGSSGFSNVAQARAMNASQKVQVGSVTKTVLALGVLRMVTRGDLSLDTDVEKLLPQLAVDNEWREDHPIRVRHLLEHTAGLDNIRMWQFMNSNPTPDSPLADAFPANNKKLLKVRTKPGAQYSYSNMGYTVLGMVIEAAMGERYESFLDQNLLRPLGMADSTFAYLSQTGPNADGAMAMGYFENSVARAAMPLYLRSAGQFTTTAPDMGRFMEFLLGGGKLDGETFIEARLMARLGSPSGTDAEKAGLTVGHGLALAIRDRHNVFGMCHPGTTLGFRAYLCLFPEQKKGFFYAINMDSETADYEQFNALFIRFLSLAESPIEKVSVPVMDLSDLPGVYLPSPNNMAQFEWLDLLFSFKLLLREGDRLSMNSLQTKQRVLLPMNNKLLRAVDRTRPSHAILRDAENTILISDGLNTFKKSSIVVPLFYWVSLILGLSGLLYLLAVGLFRLVTGKFGKLTVIALPLANLLAFSIPTFLFIRQPFSKFGDATMASVSLAVLTGLLPLTLVISVLWGLARRKGTGALRDVLASGMLLQLCAVLFFWDLVPLVFWR
jgi:CubicO group peptidase (beta-lactamase class C family)